jgi:hypothetical protein
MFGEGRREGGAAPLVGIILLVGVAIVLGVTLTVLSLTFLEGYGTPTAEASFSYEQTPVGLEMTPEAISTDVIVQLNGRDVATIDANSSGQSVLLPTAPGDEITVVSRDGDRSVLLRKRIDDRSEVGDFIAYYTFESEDGTTLEDRSGNDNDATLNGDEEDWTSNGYDFTGNDYFKVSNLNTPVSEVSEFTVAVAYETDTGDEKQELVEHISGQDNWGVELKPRDSQTYNPVFFADEEGGNQNGQIFGGEQDTDQRQVIVGTYDGSKTRIYVDGESKASTSFSSEISMGDFYIGTDAEDAGNRDNLDGRIYEIRLYYRAFDATQVRTVTNAMS